MIRRLLSLGVAISVLMSVGSGIHAAKADASIQVSATVSQSQVELGVPFQLSVTIESESRDIPSNLQVPNMGAAFNIGSVQQSMSYRNINGRVSAKKSMTYQVYPRTTGTYIIPPFKIEYEGDIIDSDPIKITVVEASPVPESSADTPSSNYSILSSQIPTRSEDITQLMSTRQLLLRADVSKDALYEGDTLIYTLRLYHRVNLWSDVSIDAPEFEGFFVEDLAVKDRYISTVGNTRYYVFELMRKRLLPTDSGRYFIPPVQVSMLVNPFDGLRRLESEPIMISVDALPKEGRPESFGSAIGRFELSLATPFPNQSPMNQPLTVRLALKGEGNLEAIQSISHSEGEEFKVYKSQVLADEVGPERLVRQFEYIVIPTESGSQDVPVFFLDYFSADTQAYEVTRTPTASIQIERGAQSVPANTKDTQQSVSIEREDIRYLKSGQATVGKSLLKLWRWGWVLNALLALSLVLRYLIKTARFSGLGRQGNRSLQAHIRQINALKYKYEDAPYFSGLATAILSFLDARTTVPAKRLTQAELLQELADLGLGEKSVEYLKQSLEQLAYAGFANQGSSPEKRKKSKQVVIRLLKRIDKELGS